MTFVKEVTAAEWDNRPRIMKVWDSNYSEAKERKVVYIVPEEYKIEYPVICLSKDGGNHLVNFKYCAEIMSTQKLEAEE